MNAKNKSFIGILKWVDYPNAKPVRVIRRAKRDGKPGYVCEYDGKATSWYPEVGAIDNYVFIPNA